MRTLGAVIVTAVLVSAFWIFFYNIRNAPQVDGEVSVSGDKTRVDSRSGTVTVAEGVTVGPSGLAIPVVGIGATDLVDTFTQARAGGARVHDAIDIMAPHGTPVVAATDGTVEKLFFSKGGGGLSVYVRSGDKRWSYYYAHLQDYATGLREGQRVKRGDVLGRVGSSGNASPDGPHLHFAVNRMEPGWRWHQGEPINPYPLLAGKAVSR